MPPKPPPDVFAFSHDPSLSPWDVSPGQWLADRGLNFDGIAVANVVFDGHGRVLLVQRAATDSLPNLWEVTGGGADHEEEEDGGRGTILGAAARELWEEAGLVAMHFAHIVQPPPLDNVSEAAAGPVPPAGCPGYVFPNRTRTKWFLRFTFRVDVVSCDRVVLDPDEHQAYVWATEREVRDGCMSDGRLIPATVPMARAVILEAFRLHSGQGTCAT